MPSEEAIQHNHSVLLHGISSPPREDSEHRPLLVLLHGLGADEYDLAGLSSELDPRLQTISLRAPYQTGYGGYSWFGIEFLENGERLMDEEQASSSLEMLVELLPKLREDSGAGKFFLAGFSQGGMMTAAIAFSNPGLIDGAWIMSGRYLPSLDGHPAMNSDLPILQQHGTLDSVLPIQEGRILSAVLHERFPLARYEEFDMAHEISRQSLASACHWITAQIDG